ncbi:MAG TPA: hypothetical protein VK759_09315 [Rhizomicrobium sp.]|jgi:hypothetical protein|nr:hypothetical protein [Rhizomicrobium sp.]
MALNFKANITEETATNLANPVVVPDGEYPAELRGARIAEAKKSGREYIAAMAALVDAKGNEREIPLFLNTSNAGLLLLMHTARAVGAEAKFTAGSIGPEDIKGPVRVVVGTEKKGKWPARNVILDVLPASSAGVVPLRSVAAE